MPYFLFVVICVIWGSNFILMKRSAEYFSPIGVGAWRAVGGVVVLSLLYFVTQQRKLVRRTDLLPLLVVVVLGFVWPHSLQPELVRRHGGAFVGMTVGFTPLMTILLSIPILGIWPTQRQVVGVIGALICIFMLFGDLERHNVPTVDILLAFSVPFSYSIANGIIRRSLTHLPALELTLLCLGIAAFILIPASIMFGNDRPVDGERVLVAVAAVVVLGVIGTGLATFLFNRLVQEQGPLFAAMTTNLIPIGAVMWGHADGEQISSTQIAALCGLLAMVSYVQFGSAKPSEVNLVTGD